MGSILTVKRSGLDEYNFEAKKSDKHSNDVYLSLINYFNGTLVSDHNTFVQFAEGDGYYGLKSIKFVPLFEIRARQKEVDVSVKPFKDISKDSVYCTAQKTAINKTRF